MEQQEAPKKFFLCSEDVSICSEMVSYHTLHKMLLSWQEGVCLQKIVVFHIEIDILLSLYYEWHSSFFSSS